MDRPRFGSGSWLSMLNKFGLTQAVLYFLSVIAGFFVCVPIGIVLRNFDGKCIIFAQVVWDGFTIYPWEEGACDFPLYSSVGIHVIYACLMGLFTLFAIIPHTHKSYDKVGFIQVSNVKYIFTAINPVFTFINSVILFMALAQALVISIGFDKFCESVADAANTHNYKLSRINATFGYNEHKSCYDVDTEHLEKMRIIGGGDHVNGKHYRVALLFAAIGGWALLVIWFLQLLLNLSQCCNGCSCKKAEEKQKESKSMQVAQLRSRMATPIGTPGHMTPRGYGAPGHMTPPVMYARQPPQPVGHQNLAYQGQVGGKHGGHPMK